MIQSRTNEPLVEVSEEDELSESPLVSAIREMGAGFREELRSLRADIRSDRKWDRLLMFTVVAIALALAWRSTLHVKTPVGAFEVRPTPSSADPFSEE
jgi:hypothetical protein